MTLINLLIVSFLSFLGNPNQPDCSLSVSSEIKDSSQGKPDGEIVIKIQGESGSGRYKVFILNQGSEIAKKELANRKVTGLKPGIYEFIVVDTKSEKCFQELKLEVKEAK
jgi:hypothetical protein